MNKTKVRNIILKLYSDNPQIVNDEAALLAAVWRFCGWDDNKSLEENVKYLPRGESVARRRRDLHIEGLIKYSDEAMDERFEAFARERELNTPKSAISWLREEN